jgi:DNA invertase Pin-like site-specific DNA recombinase
MDNKKVAIYCRVARKDDTAIEIQKDALKRFAEENGYNDILICRLEMNVTIQG